MPLANYTTEVLATKSIGEIQGMLVKHGAREILIQYDGDGEPTSLSFIIVTRDGNIPFILPANLEKVEAVLVKGKKRYRYWDTGAKKKMHAQAVRVGWRILKDWVRAQTAIIETEMVVIEQVFLPYMMTPNNKSLFEAIKDKGFYLTEGKG